MRLKGQMIYVPETDLVLFLCSPSVLNLDDLNRRGLFLSDIPLHDATRDLILLSEQFEAEYKLTKNLEILTDKLQQTYRELEDEKRKTDRLVVFGCYLKLFIITINLIYFFHSVSNIDFFIQYYHHRLQTSFVINVQCQLKNMNALPYCSVVLLVSMIIVLKMLIQKEQ